MVKTYVWEIPLQKKMSSGDVEALAFMSSQQVCLAQDLHEIKRASTPCGERKELRRPTPS